MCKQNRGLLALAVVLALAVGGLVQAREPYQTVILIPNMECGGCAKKVQAKLAEVPGVGPVQSNVEARIVTVTPQPQVVLSPRALWEAIERSGKTPTRLEGPSGTFTAKPQS